jgi:hypothetical protein
LTTPRTQEWLLIEWPEGDAEPLKYWLSTLAADTSLERLVSTSKLRWRIERDYQELKQELGLGHMRDAAGAASIIMRASASPLTDSSSPKGRRFPPQRRPKPKTARNLPFPKVIDPRISRSDLSDTRQIRSPPSDGT